MMKKPIEPGCMCVILGVTNGPEFNGMFVTAVRRCTPEEGWPDGWIIDRDISPYVAVIESALFRIDPDEEIESESEMYVPETQEENLI